MRGAGDGEAPSAALAPRLLWFALLWAAGVLARVAVALPLRWLLRMI